MTAGHGFSKRVVDSALIFVFCLVLAGLALGVAGKCSPEQVEAALTEATR